LGRARVCRTRAASRSQSVDSSRISCVTPIMSATQDSVLPSSHRPRHAISTFQRKESSVSSINRRPGLSGEMQLQLRKVTRSRCLCFAETGLYLEPPFPLGKAPDHPSAYCVGIPPPALLPPIPNYHPHPAPTLPRPSGPTTKYRARPSAGRTSARGCQPGEQTFGIGNRHGSVEARESGVACRSGRSVAVSGGFGCVPTA
jgi:hypothetical protein